MEASLKPYPDFWQAVGLLILGFFLYLIVDIVYRLMAEVFQGFGVNLFSIYCGTCI